MLKFYSVVSKTRFGKRSITNCLITSNFGALRVIFCWLSVRHVHYGDIHNLVDGLDFGDLCCLLDGTPCGSKKV